MHKVEQVDRVGCKVETESREQMSMQFRGRGRYCGVDQQEGGRCWQEGVGSWVVVVVGGLVVWSSPKYGTNFLLGLEIAQSGNGGG